MVDGVTIVPVVEELMVIDKRLMLKEELHIRRRVTKETVNFPVSLRKQRAIIERVGADSKDNPKE
jgi:stress response protein YsnF